MIRRVTVLVFIVSALVTGSAWAKELHRLYSDARVMGMGGAFVALSDDACALLYNPAGLADVKAPAFSLPLPQLEFNSHAFGMYSDASDTDFDSVQETGSFLRKNMGDTGHASLGFFPAYVRPRFAFGLLATADASVTAMNPSYPSLWIDSTQNAGVCAGYGMPMFGGDLLVGAGAKYLFRRSLDRGYTAPEITMGDFEDRVDDDFESGSGALLDLGLIYKIGSYQVSGRKGTLQVGLSVNNLGGSNMGDASDVEDHVDLGVSSHIGDNLTVCLDFADIFLQTGDDDSVGKRLHLGVEYLLRPWMKLRLGLNQGYPCFGLGLESKRMRLDFASYAEEMGTYAGQDDDRRYIMRFGFIL
jgi:hypothetical protein